MASEVRVDTPPEGRAALWHVARERPLWSRACTWREQAFHDACSNAFALSLRALPGRRLTLADPTTTIQEHVMSDDKRNVGSPDRDRINVNEAYELQYWTKTLGVSADELKAAVQKVGPLAVSVRQHLGK
ncbi:DUF3606 domain-containing protein [Xanthomonas citri]|nr:DUF3606 domain-containing protein [Xanthomonas citri]